MVSKRAQFILAQISGRDQKETNNINELTLSKDELIRKIYARQSTTGAGEFVALPWEFYEHTLEIYDNYIPTDKTSVKVEPQFKYQNGQPVSIDRIWVHIIIGKTDDGKENSRELLFKGSKELPSIENWGEMTARYTFGWYRGKNIKTKEGTIIPKGKWYWALRPKQNGDEDLVKDGETRLNEILKKDQEEAEAKE